MRNYTFLFTTFLLTALMMGCVDTDPGETEFHDRLSGIFYLYGDKTTIEDPCIHCLPGTNELTENISFSVIARLDQNNPERIQFYGIQGADTGEFGKRVFPECTRSADCEVFGTIHSEVFFEIDIENNGHRYQASGYIGTVDIELQGHYSYNDITIDYDLSGKRVSLTLDDD